MSPNLVIFCEVIFGIVDGFLQESGVQGVYKDVLLLLALYREITLANASFQHQNVSEEVSIIFWVSFSAGSEPWLAK